MGARGWPEPTEGDLSVCRTGIEMQAEAHGLDMSDPGVQSFIDNEVMVKAEMMAESRHLRVIIDRQLSENVALRSAKQEETQ